VAVAPQASAPPLQQLQKAGNASVARALAGRRVARMEKGAEEKAAPSSSGGSALPSGGSPGLTLDFLPPHTNTFYKAVSSSFLKSIKKAGLDPAHAGGIGSATFTAAALQDREYTEHDRRGQFLTPDEDYAADYAHGGKIMLRVTLTTALVESLFWLSARECYAPDLIPPSAIEYECARDEYAPLSEWDGKFASLHDRELEDSEDDSFNDD
jgi:hypothetical protein